MAILISSLHGMATGQKYTSTLIATAPSGASVAMFNMHVTTGAYPATTLVTYPFRPSKRYSVKSVARSAKRKSTMSMVDRRTYSTAHVVRAWKS
jgi:hypothetical protein